jgi:hypothetical protein
MQAQVPTTYRHYVIERLPDGSLWELGRGGMGVTYKATHTNLHSPVALKIIGPQCFGGEHSRRRFIREARLAAQIRHPNVAAIYHLDTEGAEVFYSMEFVDGVTAHAWVTKNGAMSVELALDVVMQVARALTAADRLHVVHRDIKPGNIMLLLDPADPARVIAKVIDFGLAQSLAAEAAPTLTAGGFSGTPQFSSPEQMEDLELDIRADIYSLGCTLWFLLAGEAPFVGSAARVIAQHLTSEPPWERLRSFPEPVVSLVRHMIAKDPAERPQSPLELYQEICACRDNAKRAQPQVAAIPLWPRISATLALKRPGRRTVATAAVVGFLVLGFTWFFVSARNTAGHNAPEVVTQSDAALIQAPPTPETPAVPRVEMPGDIPGLAAAASADRAENNDATRPQDDRWPWPEEASVQLTSFGSDFSSFPLTSSTLNSPEPPDLLAGYPVMLSLAGMAPAAEAISTDKASKKSTARSSQRKRVSEDRRSVPFKPIQGIRRGVEGLVNRIF